MNAKRIATAAAFVVLLGACPSGNITEPDTVDTDATDLGATDFDAVDDGVVDAGVDVTPNPDGPVQVQTTSGPIVGELEDELATFLGLPYAEPPVGDLRWAAPVAANWSTPFEATSLGKRCPQPNLTFSSLVGDEDCLTLNVWSRLDVANKPVMVWFHGGSFVQGSSTEKTYQGHDLALHDVVVVTANYRLGALGFLAHSDLSGRNFGIQDQLAVLDWVRVNAEAFGGDSGNVTVFGESAGGIAACLMVAGGHNVGRFERAISESGPCTGLLPLPDVAAAEAQGDTLAAAIACDQAIDEVACMRAAAATDVVSALGFRAGVIFGDGAAWVPVRDDDLVPVDVDAALAEATTPMLVGGNADEGSLVLVGARQGVVDVDYTAATVQMFGTHAAAVSATYPLGDYPDDAEAVAAIVGDRFVCGTRRMARLRSGGGEPVWLYHFAHSFITPIGDLGAMHGSELPFVFGTELALVKLRDDEIPLSERMQRYWSRFARTGDPNGPDDPAWPAYDIASDEHLVLDTQTTAGSGLRTAICDFWDGIDGAL